MEASYVQDEMRGKGGDGEGTAQEISANEGLD